MLVEDVGDMFVRGSGYALAFEGEDNGFGGVGGQEVVASFQDGLKGFGAGEADGEGAVDEVEDLFGGVGEVRGLESYVQEADPVFELGLHVYVLATDRG